MRIPTVAFAIVVALIAVLCTITTPPSILSAQTAGKGKAQSRSKPDATQPLLDLTARVTSIEQTLKGIAINVSSASQNSRTPYMDLRISIEGTVFGGILLGLVFFLLREFISPLPAISGCWTFETETQVTSYDPFTGMKLTFLVMMWQEGPIVSGSAEKVKEDKEGLTRTYIGGDRTRVEIRGYITKRYIRKSTVVLHFKEAGEKRKSSSIQTLRISSRRMLEGQYASTVANSSGKVRWTRGSNSFSFEDLV